MPNWNRVEDIVPCNRRNVWLWGYVIWPTIGGRKPKYLGESRYNTCANGQGKFDLETKVHWFSPIVCVTHWAEIEGPEENESVSLEDAAVRTLM